MATLSNLKKGGRKPLPTKGEVAEAAKHPGYLALAVLDDRIQLIRIPGFLNVRGRPAWGSAEAVAMIREAHRKHPGKELACTTCVPHPGVEARLPRHPVGQEGPDRMASAIPDRMDRTDKNQDASCPASRPVSCVPASTAAAKPLTTPRKSVLGCAIRTARAAAPDTDGASRPGGMVSASASGTVSSPVSEASAKDSSVYGLQARLESSPHQDPRARTRGLALPGRKAP